MVRHISSFAVCCSIGAWTLAGSLASAQTKTVEFAFEDTWLLPDISHPAWAPRLMTGRFQWTYPEGDSGAGAGQFLELDLPWWGTDLSMLLFSFEADVIEITLNGSYHDLGVDVTIRFDEPLSPESPSMIDVSGSSFEIQRGVSYQGHFQSGRVVPEQPCPADMDGDGDADGDDFFAYLDLFAAGDDRADIDGDGDRDADDFFAYLDLFARGC